MHVDGVPSCSGHSWFTNTLDLVAPSRLPQESRNLAPRLLGQGGPTLTQPAHAITGSRSAGEAAGATECALIPASAALGTLAVLLSVRNWGRKWRTALYLGAFSAALFDSH